MPTEWLNDMILMARDPLAAWLVDEIDGRVGIFANTHVSAEDIALLIDNGGARSWKGVGGSTPQRIAKTLVTLGVKKDRVWIPEEHGYRLRFKLRDHSDIPSRKFVMADVIENVYSLDDRRNQKAIEAQVAPSWL